MTIDPQLAVVLGFVFTLLIALIGWFARREVEGLHADLKTERVARALEVGKLKAEFDEALEKERDSAKKDRHDLRDAINGVGARLAELREKVLSECINHERLGAAMRPVMDRLGEIRGDIKEIYGRLDRKQDKGSD